MDRIKGKKIYPLIIIIEIKNLYYENYCEKRYQIINKKKNVCTLHLDC